MKAVFLVKNDTGYHGYAVVILNTYLHPTLQPTLQADGQQQVLKMSLKKLYWAKTVLLTANTQYLQLGVATHDTVQLFHKTFKVLIRESTHPEAQEFKVDQ